MFRAISFSADKYNYLLKEIKNKIGYNYTIMSKKIIHAIAVFDKKIKGSVIFTENIEKDTVEIDINISGLKKNGKHGFHIHEYGDMSEQCESMCAHFNPTGSHHGGPDSNIRHVGDLGNLVTDTNGVAKQHISDSLIKLRGTKYNIIGRGLIIHADEDDLGKGDNDTSLITGNAGKRIACSVIGYARPM
jgi:Cu-Zn family superoxide dismutase